MISISYLNILLYLAVSLAPAPVNVNMISIEMRGQTVYLEQFPQKELQGIWHTSLKDNQYIVLRENSAVGLVDPPPDITEMKDVFINFDSFDWESIQELSIRKKYQEILGLTWKISRDKNQIRLITNGIKHPETFVINYKGI